MDLADPPLDTAVSLCPGCGHRHTTDDARRLAWSSEHAPDGTVTFTCPGCTRADISQIEAGLPCLRHRSPVA
jgi:cell wall assembly regulator SMI1